MKVRLALFISDEVYAERFLAHFSRFYGESFDFNSYSASEYVKKALLSKKIDVLVLDAETKKEFVDEDLQNSVVLYLSEGFEENFSANDRLIKKYQRADGIYKLILNAAADIKTNAGFFGGDGQKCKIILFQNVNGGAGATSVSLAFSKYLTQKNKKVLWMSFEEFESTEVFLSDEGDFNFEDVLFALKRKKGNLMLKIESTLKEKDGISFFESCKNPMDIKNLSEEEITELLKTVSTSEKFDFIVIDKNFRLSDCAFWMQQVDKVIIVSDGTVLGKQKFERMQSAVKILEESQDLRLFSKCGLFYNKFSNKTGIEMDSDMPVYGGIPKYDASDPSKVVNGMSKMDALQALM